MTKTIRKIKKIPEFKSYEEEANFWDTHDFTDYVYSQEFKKVKLSKSPKITFTVRVDKGTVKKLDTIAKEKGVGPATLARMWLLEKLKEEQKRETKRI